MIRTHGEDRNLFSWLVLQEKILRLWIEDTLASAPSDTTFIAKLERHRDWLAAQIEHLKTKRAA
ncbi:hypothetical protein [Hyphococcus sp.]|uniref:hypothetical protein n=1 Tax=Hyphococcus sp. TaxID=2038636 RepID=UPI002089B4C4|nr:MAG: hypothetical protein DHS20C04_09930 [Marinicaulis sp.]